MEGDIGISRVLLRWPLNAAMQEVRADTSLLTSAWTVQVVCKRHSIPHKHAYNLHCRRPGCTVWWVARTLHKCCFICLPDGRPSWYATIPHHEAVLLAGLVAFELPLPYIYNDKFNQPIFGANNLSGKLP